MTDEQLAKIAAAAGLRLGRVRWNGQHIFFLERVRRHTKELLFDGQSLTRAEVEAYLVDGLEPEGISHAG
jgi:hypothetical protein